MNSSIDDSRSNEDTTPDELDEPAIAFDVTLRLPVEPLAKLVELLPITVRAKWDQNLESRYYRARARGYIGVFTADYLSIKMLGVHPSTLWGADYLNVMRELDLKLKLGKRRLGPDEPA